VVVGAGEAAAVWVKLPPAPPAPLASALATEERKYPLSLHSPAAAWLRARRSEAEAKAAAAARLDARSAGGEFTLPAFAPPSFGDVRSGAAKAQLPSAPTTSPSTSTPLTQPLPAAAPSHTSLLRSTVGPAGVEVPLQEDSQLRALWEEEVGWVSPTPQCSRSRVLGPCARALLGGEGGEGSEEDMLAAYQEWLAQGGSEPPMPLFKDEGDGEEDGEQHQHQQHQQQHQQQEPHYFATALKEGWVEAFGESAVHTTLAPFVALLSLLIMSLYFLTAFGLLRVEETSATLLGVWALGLALYFLALHPALTALQVAWRVFLWPALARALAPLPALGRASGARAWVLAAQRPTLPTRVVLSGRLELLVGSVGSAAAAKCSLAAHVAAHAPLSTIAAALHSEARWAILGAAAGSSSSSADAAAAASSAAAASLHCLLSASLGLAAGSVALPPHPPFHKQPPLGGGGGGAGEKALPGAPPGRPPQAAALAALGGGASATAPTAAAAAAAGSSAAPLDLSLRVSPTGAAGTDAPPPPPALPSAGALGESADDALSVLSAAHSPPEVVVGQKKPWVVGNTNSRSGSSSNGAAVALGGGPPRVAWGEEGSVPRRSSVGGAAPAANALARAGKGLLL
jgi:hypothetical protein